MLTTPDLWNDIADIVKKQVQRDIDNGTIADYASLDPNKLNKINTREYLAVIERLISKCEITGDFDKQLSNLQEYTKKYIDENFPIMLPQTMSNILRGYQMNQYSNLMNPAVQAFVLYVELIRQAYFYIQEKYIKKDKENFEITFIHIFLEYSMELLTGINSLLLDNNQNSLISIYRTFYENFIVFSYLQKHKELRDAFLDHSQMDILLLKIEQFKASSSAIPEDIKKEYDSYLQTYGKDFKDDYGWANSLIKDKSKLRIMFEESELGDIFNYYYKLSCKYTHATSLSLIARQDLKGIIGFLFGISDIIIHEFKELFRNINFKNKKEQILVSQWINVATMNLNKAIKELLPN